jgi:hypothetical protein
MGHMSMRIWKHPNTDIVRVIFEYDAPDDIWEINNPGSMTRVDSVPDNWIEYAPYRPPTSGFPGFPDSPTGHIVG